jgi:periplasmic copper chaperone A
VPWAPPAAKVHVAYMTVVNPGSADQVIVSAESADYERVELHRSAVTDGVSSMQALEKVTVPANRRVEFAPTGLHLMLIGPKRPPATDVLVPIVLHLGDGQHIEVSAIVRRRTSSDHGAHDHH